MDNWLLHQLNTWASHSPARFEAVLRFSDHAAWWLTAAILAGAWFVGERGAVAVEPGGRTRSDNRRRIVMILIAFVVAYTIGGILKGIVERPRPLTGEELLIPLPAEEWAFILKDYNLEEGFPSQHAALFFAITLGVWTISRVLGSAMFVISVIASMTRVAVGLHYPSDIFAGMLLGITVGMIIYIEPRPLLHRLVLQFEHYPMVLYPLGFLVLLDFSNKFAGIMGLF